MKRIFVNIFIFVLLVAGCASIETGNKMSLFDQTARAYGRAIRWGNFEEAYAFKKFANPNEKLPNFDNYRQIRVTDYVVKKTIISPDKSEILQIVDIQYYRMSDVTVNVMSVNQQWEYDAEEGRWYLLSELPGFK